MMVLWFAPPPPLQLLPQDGAEKEGRSLVGGASGKGEVGGAEGKGEAAVTLVSQRRLSEQPEPSGLLLRATPKRRSL